MPPKTILLMLGIAASIPAADGAGSSADPDRTVQGGARDEFRETLRARADATIPAYRPGPELVAPLVAMGTDTMADLMKMWIQGFTGLYPKVKMELEAKGSMTGAAPLTEGRSQFATFSREMFPVEVEAFRNKQGYDPLAIRVALGGYRAPDRTACSVFFVHKDNPITGLTMEQLGAIYSSAPGRKDITTWGQLGLTGEWVNREIHPVGIAMPDGTANYIRQFVCGGAEFKDILKGEKAGQPVKASVRILANIAQDPGAIGYASLLYDNPGTKRIAVAQTAAGPYYAGTFEEVASAVYPLTRFVYLYIDRPPGKPLKPEVREFLKYVLSLDGQRGVEREGLFLPLPLRLVAQELAKLQ